MSTHRQETIAKADERDPILGAAYRLIGVRAKWELTNMVAALSIHRFLNTKEEQERLEAAQYILRHG